MTMFHTTKLHQTQGLRADSLHPVGQWLLLLVAATLVLSLPLTACVGQGPISSVLVKIDSEFDVLNTDEQAALARSIRTIQNQQFWQIDVGALQATTQSLDWIQASAVSKRWPDVLVLKLTLATPAAVWNQDGFLDAQGVPVHSFRLQAGLPEVVAPVRFGPLAMRVLADIRRRFDDVRFLRDVRHLQIDGRGEVRVISASDMQINLGLDNLEARLDRVARFLREVKKHGSAVDGDRLISSIDARYLGGLAVSWQNQAAQDNREMLGLTEF